MKFIVIVDKHLKVKEIWLGDTKVRWIENIKMFCTSEGTRISFEILPMGIKFKFWEDEYGAGTKKNLGK